MAECNFHSVKTGLGCQFSFPPAVLKNDTTGLRCPFHFSDKIIGRTGIQELLDNNKDIIEHQFEIFKNNSRGNDFVLEDLYFPNFLELENIFDRRKILSVKVVGCIVEPLWMWTRCDFDELLFQNCKFGVGLELQDSRLRGGLSLENCSFSLSRGGAMYHGRLKLVNCEVEDRVELLSTPISSVAEFSNTKFERLYFDSSDIRDLNVDDCICSGNFEFRNCGLGQTKISSSRIRQIELGDESEVKGHFVVLDSTISDGFFAAGAANINDIGFARSEFFGPVDLSHWRTDREGEKGLNCNISDCTLREGITFRGRKFLTQPIFESTKVHGVASFDNCEFGEETSFQGNEFLSIGSIRAARAFNVLKVKMRKIGNEKEAGRFYELEQRALRKSKQGSRTDRFVSLLYDLVSRYGNSFVRPLGAIAVLFLFFFSLYMILLPGAGETTFLQKVQDMSTFTVEQAFRPFAIWSSSYKGNDLATLVLQENPLLLRLLATVQSLGAIILASMVAFALRRRFKM